VGHGRWILLLDHVSSSVNPVHTEAAALLLVTLQHPIDAEGSSGGTNIFLLAMPGHSIDPVDSAGRGTKHVQNSRVDAHTHWRLIQQTGDWDKMRLARYNIRI